MLNFGFKYWSEDFDYVVSVCKIWVRIQKKAAAGSFLTFNACWLDPEIVGTQLVKYLLFDTLDWYASGDSALGADAAVKVFNFREVMLKIRDFVKNVGWVANTVDFIRRKIRLDGCSFVRFFYES